MSTAKCCRLLDIPERTWRRKQAKAGTIGFSSGPWPRPARDRSRHVVADPGGPLVCVVGVDLGLVRG
jgi:hypothetical protein